jgi:ribokinase
MLLVVGSLNMDLVVRCGRIPAPGETVLGSGFEMVPGGKGGNQANAAARLSQQGVAMIGRVGRDVFGARLKENLRVAGVDVSGVLEVEGAATGVATITVDEGGENSIVVAGGANFVWDLGELEGLRPRFRGVRFALFQLETPLAVVGRLLRMAKEEGVSTILDPAPAQVLPRELLEAVDLLTPNETEARVLGDVGAGKVLLKLGAKGSRFGAIEVPAIAVEAVDTTAAGDTYNAGLAVGLSEGMGMERAMRFASVAAGISVTRMGAQTSAPSRAEVDAYGLSW